jgi:rhodanese-related sulfurtransferase
MYAGDVTCITAWKSLKDETAALVDVRTTREWQTIGMPDLQEIDKSVIFEEWQKFPDMALNAAFAESVDRQLQLQGVSKNDPVYCLCRSGARSQGAAATLTQLGYSRAYNVVSGFEGDPDAGGARGSINGWQYDGLPWRRE